MLEIPRGFKGIWIPKDIWLSEELTLHEKILLAEIDSLDNKNGCYAKNQHFSKFLDLSEKHISRMISKLKEKEFVEVTQENIKGITRRTIKTAYAYMRMRGTQESGGEVRIHAVPSTSNTLSNTTSEPELAQDFSLNKEIEKLEESPRRDLNIIGLYFAERKPDLQNKAQLQTAIRRHLRPAKSLVPFTDNQILGAVPRAKKITDEWTIETLEKVLTK